MGRGHYARLMHVFLLAHMHDYRACPGDKLHLPARPSIVYTRLASHDVGLQYGEILLAEVVTAMIHALRIKSWSSLPIRESL
jgi:hypothetical protein